MTTITGTVSGYTIMSPATTLSITTTGYVNGPGVRGESTGSYTVVSDGRIAGTGNGVSLDGADCSVTNGSVAHTTASIYGYTHGVALYGANGAVANFGVITEGLDGHFTNAVISLVSGGSVTNGSSGDTHALIEGSRAVDIGIDSGAGTVTNFGSIIATGYGISPLEPSSAKAAGSPMAPPSTPRP